MARNVRRGVKERKPIPFTQGAYVREEQLRARAQEFFLWVVHGMTSTPLYRLRDQIFPKYCAAFELEAGQDRTGSEIRNHAYQILVDVTLAAELEGLSALPEFQAEQAGFRLLYDATEELTSWANRFNLRGTQSDVADAPNAASAAVTRQRVLWPVIAALETVLDWQFGPTGWLRRSQKPPLWRAPIWLPRLLPEQGEKLPGIKLRVPVCRFPRTAALDSPAVTEGIDQPAWQLEYETEEQFRERVRGSFELWLDAYINSKTEEARQNCLLEVPGKRQLNHFQWAARYQIDGVSCSAIAKPNELTADAV
jgi:hypothetical protein